RSKDQTTTAASESAEESGFDETGRAPRSIEGCNRTLGGCHSRNPSAFSTFESRRREHSRSCVSTNTSPVVEGREALVVVAAGNRVFRHVGGVFPTQIPIRVDLRRASHARARNIRDSASQVWGPLCAPHLFRSLVDKPVEGTACPREQLITRGFTYRARLDMARSTSLASHGILA